MNHPRERYLFLPITQEMSTSIYLAISLSLSDPRPLLAHAQIHTQSHPHTIRHATATGPLINSKMQQLNQ